MRPRPIRSHPLTLLAMAVVIGIAWIAQIWFFAFITNHDDYLAALSNGSFHLQLTWRDCPASIRSWAGPDKTDPRHPDTILGGRVAGQEFLFNWTRDAHDEFEWTDALGGWPSIGMIEEGFDWGWFLHIPLWLPLLIIALLIWRWYRRHRPPPGTCRRCGYNLTGNVSGRCPECGTWISEAGAAERATER